MEAPFFTGDAGQGESNIRRWILENDWLEAIIALPLNMFYNTGIATYIWVLTNRKPEHRRGKVQLIDVTAWFKPLRKNLGSKNCEFGGEHIQQIVAAFLAFEETEQSKILPNEAFGYWKVTVERPLRLSVDLSECNRTAFRKTCVDADETPLANMVDRLAAKLGPGPHADWNTFFAAVEWDAQHYSLKLPAKRIKLLQTELAAKEETAAPVIRKVHKPSVEANPLHGPCSVPRNGKPCVVEYEPDPDLRDTESVPLLEPGGIEAFIRREVLTHVPDAWILTDKTQIGYEISFTRYFYKPKPMRTLKEIRRDIEALEQETEGLLHEIMDVTAV